MKRLFTAGALGLALLGALSFVPGEADTAVPPQGPGKGPANVAPVSKEVLSRGEYLVHMGDCTACHTANGGTPFAGGQLMGMPFGAISTPNITPDVETGIGHYDDAEFIKLMRHGVTPDGTLIYPAMPYSWFNTTSEQDLLAIKAFLFTKAPIHAPRVPSPIWFPFNIRPGLALWNVFFVPDKLWAPDPKLTDEQNLGSYIVNGFEHCGACHNHRNLMGNTEAAGNVQGGPIDLWYAPNLRNDKETGLGRYTDADIVQYLREGWSEAMGPTAGPMGQTVDESLSKLSDHDLHAIVAYLRTLPATPAYTPRKVNSDSVRAGETVYLSHCASCHQVNGQGVKNAIPALDGNGAVRAAGSHNVIRVVLGGMEARGPYAVMPGLGAEMTDQQIADVTNYVRQAWSNAAPPNTGPLTVSILRDETHTLLNGTRPDGCPKLVQPQLEAALADKSNGLADLLQNMTLPTVLQTADTMVPKLKQVASGVSKADIVNGMTVAYCPIVAADKTLAPDKRVWQMTHFADRLWTQLSTNGNY